MVFGSRLQDTAFDLGFVCLHSDLARSRDLPEIHGQYPAARRRGHGQLLYRAGTEYLLFVRRYDDGQRPCNDEYRPEETCGSRGESPLGNGHDPWRDR